MPTFPSPQGLLLGPTHHWFSLARLPPSRQQAECSSGTGGGWGVGGPSLPGPGPGGLLATSRAGGSWAPSPERRTEPGEPPCSPGRAPPALPTSPAPPLALPTSPAPPLALPMSPAPPPPRAVNLRRGVPGTGEQVSAIRVTVDMGREGLSGQLWGEALALRGQPPAANRSVPCSPAPPAGTAYWSRLRGPGHPWFHVAHQQLLSQKSPRSSSPDGWALGVLPA